MYALQSFHVDKIRFQLESIKGIHICNRIIKRLLDCLFDDEVLNFEAIDCGSHRPASFYWFDSANSSIKMKRQKAKLSSMKKQRKEKIRKVRKEDRQRQTFFDNEEGGFRAVNINKIIKQQADN